MDSDATEEAAARWFAKRERGEWTEADQAQLEAWLEASTAHRIQYLRVETAWKHAARLKALGAGVPAGVIPARGSWGDARFLRGTLPQAHSSASAADPDTPETHYASAFDSEGFSAAAQGGLPGRTRIRAARFKLNLPAALAASVLFLLVGAGGVYMYSGLLAGDRYATSIGGIDAVALSDGSQVTLNTDSRIRVELRDRERRISLNKGEAFFEVAKDPTRPFVVEAGDRRVIAVGTKFSVRREGGDIQVVVIEGKVRIETGGAGVRPSSSTTLRSPSDEYAVLLEAGSVARTAKDEVLVRADAASEAQKLLSWRNGYVAFDDVALADAVAEFNRYNTRKILIEDPEIANLRLGGNFRANNTEAFLWLLESGFPIAVERREDEVALKAR